MATGGAESRRDPWTVAVEDPRGAGATAGLVRLGGACIATSGDYLHSFTEDRRHHHIIDPRTGYSPEHSSAVTVTARRAMEADALSTAVMVLGGPDGLALLDHFPGTELMAVDKRGGRTLSSGFAIART